MDKKYEKIINLPHHVSLVRPQMSMHDRAAQFAAFQALTGLDEDMKKTEKNNEDRFYENGDKKYVLGTKYDG